MLVTVESSIARLFSKSEPSDKSVFRPVGDFSDYWSSGIMSRRQQVLLSGVQGRQICTNGTAESMFRVIKSFAISTNISTQCLVEICGGVNVDSSAPWQPSLHVVGSLRCLHESLE